MSDVRTQRKYHGKKSLVNKQNCKAGLFLKYSVNFSQIFLIKCPNDTYIPIF